MEYIIIISRTLFFYFLVVMIYRLMGKREVAQLGIVDLIISFLIAELVAVGIDNFDESIWRSLLPILILTFVQIILAFSTLKLPKFRILLDGQPTMIIKSGKVNFKQMFKQRYNLDDLMAQLRAKGVRNIEEVEYAILETNGTLSIFKYNFFKLKSNLPLPLILDGKINKETLRYLNKDLVWLNSILEKKNVEVNQVFYAFNKGQENYIIKKEQF